MPAALSRPLRIGTDCSGMETPVMALKKLHVQHEHVFSCDIDRHVKAQIFENFAPKKWFDDLMKRDNSANTTPDTDLYIAGFPCQSFSGAGKQKGFKDDRGMVFFGCARFIEAKRPRAFILENVKGLFSHDDGKSFKKVKSVLEGIGNGAYTVHIQLLDTQDHGVPQSRPRVYLVGIRKDCQQSEFSFPEKLPRVSIESLLDPVKRRPTLKDLPPKSSGTAHRNVKQAMRKLIAAGEKPLSKAFLMDCDSSSGRDGVMKDKTMCITKSRSHGFWVSSRGRRMNLNEMLRCQGMQKCFKQVVSDRALGAQIGNAMSQNILERLLAKLLPAAGLVSQKRRLRDRWALAAKSAAAKCRAARTKRGMLRKRSSSEAASSAKRARTA